MWFLALWRGLLARILTLSPNPDPNQNPSPTSAPTPNRFLRTALSLLSMNSRIFYVHSSRLKTCASRLFFAFEVERSSMGGADTGGPTAADGLRGGVRGWPGGGGQCHGRDGENCLVLTFFYRYARKENGRLRFEYRYTELFFFFARCHR